MRESYHTRSDTIRCMSHHAASVPVPAQKHFGTFLIKEF